MVRAILDDRKTQTRRVIKPQPSDWKWNHYKWDDRCINVAMTEDLDGYYVICPYGQPGDHLWVRETIKRRSRQDGKDVCTYNADLTGVIGNNPPESRMGRAVWQWPKIKSLTRIPRWASRITMKITGVRVERVQEISEKDAIAEGIPRELGGWGNMYGYYTNAYKELWDTINANRGFPWESNPWVWVIDFKRV